MFIAVIGFLLMTSELTKEEVESLTPEEQFSALRDEHDSAFQEFAKASDEAKTEQDQKALDDHPGRHPRRFALRFMSLGVRPNNDFG